ncbi:sugar transporter ERD6-like 5 isoform X2 [Morus notabilis]|uniref:sugar transporter ERD6-like 5 isoform X2 n=1 Tax=Morus notabilis TaxID=981085 RepID=UPI000CECFCE5|nr:sugar transporter ERD6-like 5 isoform X2 [Morus notabilis]
MEGVETPFLIGREKLDNNNGQGSSYNQDSSSQSPLTFAVVLTTLVLYCGSYAAGNSMGYSSPAESGIINDLGLTLPQYSVFVSIVLVGMVFGAVLSGKTADVIGRRGTLGVADLFSITGWLAITFSKGALWLDVGRFLLGFSIGLCSYAGPIFVAEITPQNVRGALMSVVALTTTFGTAVFFLIGPLVNWRTLSLIGVVPYLLQLPGLLMIPESPRWLMKVGRAEECENALRRLRGEKADISKEKADIKDHIEHSNRTSEDGILSVFQRKYARCLIIGIGLVALPQFGGSGAVSFYTSSIFQSAGFSSRFGSVAVGTTQVLTAILGVLFIDKFGRRPLLLISAVGTCLGSLLIGLSFFLQDNLHFWERNSPVLSLIGVLVYVGFYSLGLAGIPLIISSEIFPMNVKGSAGSIIYVILYSSSWVISYTYNFMFQWNSAGTFLIFAAISGGTILFIWKMVPETKGRTLEEIQASIIHE